MSFAGFPNQSRVVELLRRSIDRGRLAHAYLFTGPQLGELEAMAVTLAKVLNCTTRRDRGASSVATDSCDQCDSCRRIDLENHPDVRWIRPESKSRQITIDQLRGLIESVQLKPNEAEFKVAVIVSADRLHSAAANAFLKTLEEPPPRSVLILLSVEPGRLIETILSRCLRLEFSRDGVTRLDSAQESLLQAFGDAVMTGECGLLDRYRLLGVLQSHLAAARAEIDSELTARSPLERTVDVEPELRERWEEELAAAIEAGYRCRRSELLAALQWWLRDVWLGTLSMNPGLFGLPQMEKATHSMTRRLTPERAGENLDRISRIQQSLHTNVQEALALEVGILNLHL